MGEKKIAPVESLIIVDDETDMLNLYRHFFRRETSLGNFHLLCFTSGKECLDYLLLYPQEGASTLIISDINMPEMSGFDLLERLKQMDPNMSVWIASAYSGDEYKKKAINGGAEGYFEKPIDFKLLKAAIALRVK